MNFSKASDLKTFIGSKDFGISKEFYLNVGFQINWEKEKLIEFEISGCNFLLQDYYDKNWCENMMMHLTVDDVVSWHSHMCKILTNRKYGLAKCRAPQREDYGALVMYFWDPSGVLWHLAEFD